MRGRFTPFIADVSSVSVNRSSELILICLHDGAYCANRPMSSCTESSSWFGTRHASEDVIIMCRVNPNLLPRDNHVVASIRDMRGRRMYDDQKAPLFMMMLRQSLHTCERVVLCLTNTLNPRKYVPQTMSSIFVVNSMGMMLNGLWWY